MPGALPGAGEVVEAGRRFSDWRRWTGACAGANGAGDGAVSGALALDADADDSGAG